MSSPAPALLPLPRSLRTPRRSAPRESGTVVMEAPGQQSLEVDAYLLCVRVRAVGGNTADAMEQCIAKLVRSYQERLRSERLAAETLVPPAPSSIHGAVLAACEEHDPLTTHDMGCECPECFPVDDDDATHYCADEGHQVLTSGAAYYGVVGQW